MKNDDSIFWVGDGGWTFFMGGWERMDIFYVWVGVAKGIFWVDWGEWEWLLVLV